MINIPELSRAEKTRGLVKPFREVFKHTLCNRRMRWTFEEALGHARRLKPRRFQWCSHCQKYDVVAHFEFESRSSVPGVVKVESMRVWEFSTGVNS
jgi:hypothetical protein